MWRFCPRRTLPNCLAVKAGERMHISKICAVFFSPAGGTEKVLEAFLQALPQPAEKINLTPFSQAAQSRVFSPDELVIFAAPVYAGRMVPLALLRLSALRGRCTPAVCLAVYGNRAYEDALLELTDSAKQNGFVPFASAAAVAQHSIMRSVAAGRPDAADKAQLTAFAQACWDKLIGACSAQALSIPQVPGHTPYKPFKAVGFVPAASSACTHCGRCAAHCPSGAISTASPDKTDKTRCIFCMGCVSVCPVQARGVNKALLWAAEKAFALKFSARQEPQFFI